MPFGSGVKPKYAVSSPISARGSRSFLSEKTSSWNSTNVGDTYASSSRGSLSSRSTQNRSGHQLSDSGHHEDLSPGGKRRISTKEKGCTFFERLTIKGHDVELLVDDEDLLGVCTCSWNFWWCRFGWTFSSNYRRLKIHYSILSRKQDEFGIAVINHGKWCLYSWKIAMISCYIWWNFYAFKKYSIYPLFIFCCVMHFITGHSWSSAKSVRCRTRKTYVERSFY